MIKYRMRCCLSWLVVTFAITCASQAIGQEIDCVNDFELYLPLLEKSLTILEQQQNSWTYQPEAYLDYIDQCQDQNDIYKVRVNLAISQFLNSNRDTTAENMKALEVFALEGSEDAMLQLMAIFEFSNSHNNAFQNLLGLLIDQDNADALLYYAFKLFEFPPANEADHILIFETLLEAIKFGQGDACYYLSPAIFNNIGPFPVSATMDVLDSAIDSGASQCYVAKYYVCYAALQVAAENSNFHDDNCIRYIDMAVESGVVYAEFLQASFLK